MNKKVWTSSAVVLILMMLGLQLFVWFWGRENAPTGHMFVPYHNSVVDYPWYTAFIKQGIEGKIGTTNPYAIESHARSYLYIFYNALGLFARVFFIHDAHIIYLLARLSLGLLWCFVLYIWLNYFLHTKWQKTLALCFAVFSSSWPIITMTQGHIDVSWFMSWWTEFDPISRFGFMPHYEAGHILLITTIYLFFMSVEKGQKKHLIYAIITGWLAGFIHPPSLIVLILILPLYMCMCFSWKLVFHTLIFVIITTTSLLLLNYASQSFPWDIVREYESTSFFILITHHILAFGPLFVFAMIGALATIKKKHTQFFLLWIAIPVICSYDLVNRPPLVHYPILKILFPISNIRFLQMELWAPLSVLAVWGIGWIQKKFHRGVSILLIGAWCILTCIGYPAQIKNLQRVQFGGAGMTGDFYAPKNEWFAAARALSSAPVANKTVMAMPYAGRLLPSYSGFTTYVGHEFNTPRYYDKLVTSFAFFKGNMSSCEAFDVLNKNHIATVFYGFDEEAIGNTVTTMEFLHLWKTIGNTKIYLVDQAKPQACPSH